tara:strand:- start:573 stop:749 length:177 start_codon:yes stop_codon:yes gene_type:complete
LAQGYGDTGAAMPALEPGADIVPIGRELGQLYIAMHAAAPAMAGKLVAVPEKVTEGLK